jgi:hypothetical protein
MDNLNSNFITNTKNYQGINPLSYATVEPTIDIATISNFKIGDNIEIDNTISLTPFDISYNDFMACFYHQPGANFSINQANIAFKPIVLSGQTYTTTNNNLFSWDLYNQCIKTFCEKNFISETSISSLKKIKLNKETFSTQSLVSNSGFQVGLNWDMVINNLQVNNKIIYTKDSEDFANVNFKIAYIYQCKTLDVTLEINFIYRTSVPNYQNIYNVNNVDNTVISPYSKNEVNEQHDTSNILSNFTGISELIDNAPRNKKEKKKNKKREQRKISINTEPNLHVSDDSAENDNDSVLTKNIVHSSRIKPFLQTTYENDENDENSDNENKSW